MADISAEEWQFLSIFEAEPSLLDADVPWCYNDAVYRVQQGSLVLSFAIAPAYRDVRILLANRGTNVYELNAMNVVDIRYIEDGHLEQLEIVLSEQQTIRLQVKPDIRIVHAAKNHP